jgi:hypothetical protein
LNRATWLYHLVKIVRLVTIAHEVWIPIAVMIVDGACTDVIVHNDKE